MPYQSTNDTMALMEQVEAHAKHCHRCFMPIIDEEGNPGYFGEACTAGLRLLVRYVVAIGETVPSAYQHALDSATCTTCTT